MSEQFPERFFKRCHDFLSRKLQVSETVLNFHGEIMQACFLSCNVVFGMNDDFN